VSSPARVRRPHGSSHDRTRRKGRGGAPPTCREVARPPLPVLRLLRLDDGVGARPPRRIWLLLPQGGRPRAGRSPRASSSIVRRELCPRAQGLPPPLHVLCLPRLDSGVGARPPPVLLPCSRADRGCPCFSRIKAGASSPRGEPDRALSPTCFS
jgi:hypothetical protein